jgi:hypothetical protein
LEKGGKEEGKGTMNMDSMDWKMSFEAKKELMDMVKLHNS